MEILRHWSPFVNLEKYRAKVAAVSGLDISDVDLKQVGKETIFQMDPENEIEDFLFTYAFDENTMAPTAEKAVEIYHIGEELLGVDPRNVSYGIYFPSYHKMLEEHRASRPAEKPYKALLAGALSLDTVKEFAHGVGRVIKDPELYTVDIRGNRTAHQNFTQFVRGDILSLPFRENTFSSIHSNALIHHLEDPNKVCTDEVDNTRYYYFSEAFRTLEEQGRLQMVELGFYRGFDLREGIHDDLKQAGFVDIQIQPARYFKSRTRMASYFEDNKSNIQKFATKQDQTFIAVSAVKPQA